ncbi:hypothetical protein BGZ76_000355 [Entomortierella beljakovae]|nr:hypothetical protein BGZ76_000355 [Entomortierella beljakovae]
MSLERSVSGVGQSSSEDQPSPFGQEGFLRPLNVDSESQDLVAYPSGTNEFLSQFSTLYPSLTLNDYELLFTQNEHDSLYPCEIFPPPSPPLLMELPIQFTSPEQLTTPDLAQSNNSSQPKESMSRTQLTLGEKLDIFYLNQLLSSVKNGKQFICRIYKAGRTTGYDQDSELCRVPKEHLNDKKRITVGIRNEMNNVGDFIETGKAKLEEAVSLLTHVAGFTFSDREFTGIPQLLFSYLERISKSGKPLGCIFQNFSMHWLMRNMNDKNDHVWFYEIIEVTASFSFDGEREGYALHIIGSSGTGAMYSSDIVRVKDNDHIVEWLNANSMSSNDLRKTQTDSRFNEFADPLGMLGLYGLRGQCTLACMDELQLICLIPEPLSFNVINSNDNIKAKVMGIPDRLNTNLPLRDFARNIKSEYTLYLTNTSKYPDQHYHLRNLVNKYSRVSNIPSRFSEFKSILSV